MKILSKVFMYSISSVSCIMAYTDIQFFRATPLINEPRLERPWLTSVDIAIGHGTTRKSFNSDHEKVPLFDVWGTSNMQQLGAGINLDAQNPLDQILLQLQALPSQGTFGTFSTLARFKLTEYSFTLTQNFSRGLFAQIYLPVRSYSVSGVQFVDLSSDDQSTLNKLNPVWLTFLSNFNAILHRYSINTDPVNQTGVGDLVLLGGWTYSYQDTQELDFIDTTLQAGFVVPTAKAKDQNKLFEIPLGYNKHLGFPLRALVAFGAYDWLTIGGSLQTVIFAAKKEDVRLPTSLQQKGLINLATVPAKTRPGTIWVMQTFIKADHFVRGLSLGAGYTYATQQRTDVTPLTQQTTVAIIKNSPQFAGFAQHTFHTYIEYDFTQQDWKYGPRIGLAYNKILSGKRVFKTDMLQGTFGLEIVWDY